MAGEEQLGKYRIVETIGSGGFATVHKAYDNTLDHYVALKILHPAFYIDRVFVERFFREARIVRQLRHPGIVTIYEVGQADGRVFIAMELAATSLAERLAEQGVTPWQATLAFLRPICEALDYAHQRGVVHRDLKPANILLTEDGRPLITDFGFARLASQSSASMSASGGILGTPGYIAPEVWDHDSAQPPADRYALACITFEMLTGKVLFEGASPLQAMRAHDRGPQFPHRWPAGIPDGLSGVLAMALHREPEQRFSSALAFWEALHNLPASTTPSVPVPAEQMTVAGKQPEAAVPAATTVASVNEAHHAGASAPVPASKGRARTAGSGKRPWLPVVGVIAALGLAAIVGAGSILPNVAGESGATPTMSVTAVPTNTRNPTSTRTRTPSATRTVVTVPTPTAAAPAVVPAPYTAPTAAPTVPPTEPPPTPTDTPTTTNPVNPGVGPASDEFRILPSNTPTSKPIVVATAVWIVPLNTPTSTSWSIRIP